MRVSVNGAFAYVDYIVALSWGYRKEALIYSCFERSEMVLRSFSANLSLSSSALYLEDDRKDMVMFPRTDVDSYHTTLIRGKEPVNHALSISKAVNNKYILTTQEHVHTDIYNWLMSNFDYPLLPEWIPYLMEAGAESMQPVETVVYGRKPDWTESLLAFEVSLTDCVLQELVSCGLRDGKISIASQPQKPLAFDNMDDYFLKYGNSLIDNLEKKLDPLVDLKDSVDEVAFLEKRFYPQQAAIVNGLMACMKHGSYAFLNEDMGCGKTLQGMGVPEGFFVQMVMNRTGRDVRDIYMDASAVKYRNIVMCPPHLVKKWEEAIKADIPYAKVTIIRGIKELCRLRKRGKERTGKEFYIMSKETGKLSYTYMPLPTQVKKKKVTMVVCKDCGQPRPGTLPAKCICGCGEWKVKDCDFSAVGMVCPDCGQLLYATDVKSCADREKMPLKPADFAMQTKTNRTCRHCGGSLWQPACEPVNRTLAFKPIRVHKKGWVKVTHWANQAKKNKKSVWVHERWKQEYFEENGLSEEEVTYPKVTGVRRFAPSRYIKKYLKGFFDFAVFDEAHEYKGGGSAQGMAMHDLIKASRWHLALTGTIAGGYASHFFYLLYRLDPARMKAMGYSYGSEGERKFVERYGTVATEYEVEKDHDGSYNSMSRGRQLGSPKCRPGISPDIFTHFLLDRAVFLNLSDMSSYLPPLNEYVEYIPLEEEIASAYDGVRDTLKKAMYERNLGRSVLGTFLQFSLSYTDKPYGRSPIISPVDGSLVAHVPNLSHLVAEGRLLNKERRLCELVTQEMAENRNVVIYCEYTGNGEANVTRRLKEIIQKNCGLSDKEVEILESGHPVAEEREEWMHEKAAKGVKVFITNPKCVKTGLDFLFYYRNVMYNFPTIIFYQYSYDLFTMWQASRRHYRLNQILGCRTFYLLSSHTIQVDALEMVASKQVATSAIQGHFSSEGLCAMAQGVDPRIKLAQAAAEKSPDQIKGLKSMFDVLNQWHSGSGVKKEEKGMPTFYELTGIDLKKELGRSGLLVTDSGESVDFFGMFGMGSEEKKEAAPKSAVEPEKGREEAAVAVAVTIEEVEQDDTDRKETLQDAGSFFCLFGDTDISGHFRKAGSRPKKQPKGMKQVINF